MVSRLASDGRTAGGMPGSGQPWGLRKLWKQPKIWEARRPREFKEQCKTSDMPAFERLQYLV